MTEGSDSNLGPQVRRVAQNALTLVTGGLVTQFAFTFLEILRARPRRRRIWRVRHGVRVDGPRLARRGLRNPILDNSGRLASPRSFALAVGIRPRHRSLFLLRFVYFTRGVQWRLCAPPGPGFPAGHCAIRPGTDCTADAGDGVLQHTDDARQCPVPGIGACRHYAALPRPLGRRTHTDGCRPGLRRRRRRSISRSTSSCFPPLRECGRPAAALGTENMTASSPVVHRSPGRPRRRQLPAALMRRSTNRRPVDRSATFSVHL